LQESLRKLYAVDSSRESFAGEAVRLLARTANAKAAALLVCDYRASRVRLIGSVGADPNVFRALLTRSGVWIALRPLNERRINVILRAEQNPFVPQTLVTSINPTGLGIAVVPFYKGNLPVGVLVLFSSQESTFSQALLQTLAQALRVCAVALEDAFEARGHRRLGTITSPPSELEFTAEAVPPPAAPSPPTDVEELLETERNRISELETELGTLREAKDRLPTLQAEVERLNEEAQQARAAADAARARAAMLEAERAEAENRALAAAEMLQALMEARDEQQHRIEETLHRARIHTDTVADLDTQLRALSDRIQQADEIEIRLRDSEQARTDLEARARKLSERAREAEDLAARLSASETARVALEAQVRELSDRSRQAAEEFAQRLRNGEMARAELEEQIVELAAAHEQKREQLREQSELLEAARAEAHAARDKARTAEAERDRLQSEQLGVRCQLDAVMAERTALRDALHAAQTSLAEKASEEAVSTGTWSNKIHDLEQERDRLKTEVVQLRNAFESTFTRLRAQIEQTVLEKHEIERRLASLAGVEGEAHNLRSRVTELEGELASLRQAAETERPANTAFAKHTLAAGVLDQEQREVFSTEACEHIEASNQILSRIDDDICNRDLYRILLDRFHRLKGTAAAVGLDTIVAQLHEGGSILEAIVEGAHVSDAPTVVFLRRLIGSVDALVHQTLGLDASAFPILIDVGQELAKLRGLTPPPPRVHPAAVAVTAAGDPDSGVLRVEAVRLDALLDTIGQLETNRAQTHREAHATGVLRDQLNAWRAQFVERDRTALEGGERVDDHTFYKAFATQSAHIVKQLSRLLDSLNERDSTLAAVSGDLQQKVDALRLVPLDTVFRRLRRPVRDAARQEGKLAELVAEGGEIQVDRTVIEPLHAALLHLVRNAVAHGIESRDGRAAARKPTQGTVRVTARVVSKGRTRGKAKRGTAAAPRLELTVADDGAGLDLRAVLARARDRGLLRPDETPDDARLEELIFEPGLSTARAVNGLAGRGVGMDVVRQEVAALGGTVNVESERGHGTRVVLRVPVRTAVQ
jgi:signal transduction histidine kinase